MYINLYEPASPELVNMSVKAEVERATVLPLVTKSSGSCTIVIALYTFPLLSSIEMLESN